MQLFHCDKPYNLDEAAARRGTPRRKRKDSRTTAYELTIRIPEEHRRHFGRKKKLTRVVFALNKKVDLKGQVRAFEEEKNAVLDLALEARGGGSLDAAAWAAMPFGEYAERYVERRVGVIADVYGLSRLSTSGGSEDLAIADTYLEDGLGSVSAVLREGGAVAASLSYSPWGEEEPATESLPGYGDRFERPHYGYNAEPTSPEGGLQYLRARWYDPAMGAFGSRDSLLGDAADPATLNRYAYAEGNPVAACDPTGHAAKRRYDPRLNIQKPLATIRKKSKAPGSAAKIGVGKVVADIASRTTRAVSAAIRYGKASAGKSVVAKGARVVAAVPPSSSRRASSSAHIAYAQKRRALVNQLFCGTAAPLYDRSAAAGATPTIRYNRDDAIRFAKEYASDLSDGGQALEMLEVWWKYGRSKDYPSFEQNCANFASQVLHAGGLPMTDDWHAWERWGAPPTSSMTFNKFWEWTTAWTVAQDQYEYFSDEANGMTESKVVDLSFNPRGDTDKEDITFDDWDKKWDGYGIQKGDLMFFYNGEGAPPHAAVVSRIDETGIYYAANSNRRFDENLEGALNRGSWEEGVFIVRIKDR